METVSHTLETFMELTTIGLAMSYLEIGPTVINTKAPVYERLRVRHVDDDTLNS